MVMAKLSRGLVKAIPHATRESLNKRCVAMKGYMMNCVQQLNVYQRRTSILTRNFTILHHITLVRFVVSLAAYLTDGALSVVIPRAGIMEAAAHNGINEKDKK